MRSSLREDFSRGQANGNYTVKARGDLRLRRKSSVIYTQAHKADFREAE